MNLVKQIIKKLLFFCLDLLPPRLANQLPLLTGNKKERWAIGIYEGNSPLNFHDSEKINNPVIDRKNITDVRAGFVADPFMLEVEQNWQMFFEVLNQKTQRGEIGLATSQNTIDWTYQKIVITEPFHLSYPYVFQWENEYYLIPESFEANSVRLYKATNFPWEWSFVGNILEGCFLDTSVFRYADKWWLLAETSPHHKFDTLRLYYADDLLGDWIEHPQSPIVEGNAHIARPGGRVVIVDNKIIRYSQDCVPDYGTQVRAFEILELTTTSYREREVDTGLILKPSGIGWNGSGMHHIDPHLIADGKWIACVDGRVKC
ncbi:MAG: hypothetical protein HC930_10995 [Hydrococcus sp. SU_1_0]|nr:hypothetical protein [Hydrococcus sp. SU_1_0]